MNWLNIKEVLPPETIREMLNEHNISMIKYYPKPRKINSYTTILIEVLNRDKEIAPTSIEVCEAIPYSSVYGNEKEITITEKVIRCRDRPIFSREEINKIGTVFKLLGLKVRI